MATNLNAHAKPPAAIKEVYKRFQKLPVTELKHCGDLVDSQVVSKATNFDDATTDSFVNLPAEIRQVFERFAGQHVASIPEPTCYASRDVPGLYIYPDLIPPQAQLELLQKSFLRDLSNQQHQTNVHMHYHVPYPPDQCSYFDSTTGNLTFEPLDPSVHKPITTQQYLSKKLRWMTLGGQYDWTNKVYPDGTPPSFPSDLKGLVEDLFPMRAEAAIVNLYSPGDTLSLHRDVSEECNQPLASISLGCDGIFVIGLDAKDDGGPPRVATLRLRSGDAVLMSGESRYAWHGVPKVLEKTCPEWMQQWPGQTYPAWDGWMERKRINLNVRQMFD